MQVHGGYGGGGFPGHTPTGGCGTVSASGATSVQGAQGARVCAGRLSADGGNGKLLFGSEHVARRDRAEPVPAGRGGGRDVVRRDVRADRRVGVGSVARG